MPTARSHGEIKINPDQLPWFLPTNYEVIDMSAEVPSFQPLLLNVNQVAQLLGCHRNTIWNRVQQNHLPCPIKWEGKTVWRRVDIESFVDKLGD